MEEEKEARSVSLPVAIGFGLVACALYGLGAGLRSDIGILLNPLAEQCGVAYASASLCVAVMQLVFGASQPIFGIVASRRSNRFVLFLGVAFMATSIVGMALARSFFALLITLGLLFGLGAGAIAFGLVLTSAIHFVGQNRAMTISGMLNAAAGMVGFALSPAVQALLSSLGTRPTLLCLLIPVGILAPLVLVVTSRDPRPKPGPDNPGETHGASAERPALPFSKAFHNRTYLLLVAGFSTCGFHMVIIESHLFNQFVLYGIDATSASWAFSVYGIATIVGALLSGWLSTHVRKGRLLGFYYGFRAVWDVAFLLLMPKTLPFAVLFSIGLGMTGDATVSPTSGLVSENFALEHVATLVGFLFLCHQVGAFASAWLGGIILDATGAYTLIWVLDIALCTFASIMSLRIQTPSTR